MSLLFVAAISVSVGFLLGCEWTRNAMQKAYRQAVMNTLDMVVGPPKPDYSNPKIVPFPRKR